MKSHGNYHPDRDTQNLAIDPEANLSEEMDEMVSPSLWKMIAPGYLDGPLLAFYIFLLLFLVALARAICC
jgi:hypothetical protein